uniref:Uncharacterized protein n=1 Tax=Marseillevirus LCMAC201 TaxID=2506605 RepID=A0A481YWM9_9VIRU|nr:MAG: hypothetical protein LCMAC201_04190 [Marseillevirus LCMAC201]
MSTTHDFPYIYIRNFFRELLEQNHFIKTLSKVKPDYINKFVTDTYNRISANEDIQQLLNTKIELSAVLCDSVSVITGNPDDENLFCVLDRDEIISTVYNKFILIHYELLNIISDELVSDASQSTIDSIYDSIQSIGLDLKLFKAYLLDAKIDIEGTFIKDWEKILENVKENEEEHTHKEYLSNQ